MIKDVNWTGSVQSDEDMKMKEKPKKSKEANK